MLTPKVKATLFIPTPRRPIPAIESRSLLPGLSSPTKNTITTSRSPARVNLRATKGNAGTSETATLTATGLVPRKSTAKSSEASVTRAVLSLNVLTALDSTPGPPGAQSDSPNRSWVLRGRGAIVPGIGNSQEPVHPKFGEHQVLYVTALRSGQSSSYARMMVRTTRRATISIL